MLSAAREHQNLYPWSIKEFKNGKQVGGDQIPWDWALNFEVVELIPTFKVEFSGDDADQSATSKAELSEYLYGKLRPSSASRQSGIYSMLGTDRQISEFGLFIYKAMDGKNRCSVWGSVSYTSEWDFENSTQQVQIYAYLSEDKFDRLMEFVKFPRPTGANIRLRGVSGFYSEWSPSIRTDIVKILANAKDQQLEDPEGLAFTPPTLGYVKEFELALQQQYPIHAKGS